MFLPSESFVRFHPQSLGFHHLLYHITSASISSSIRTDIYRYRLYLITSI